MQTRRKIRDAKLIGAQLKRAREALHLNQTEFAGKAGMSQHRYNQYETGAKPLTIDAALLLCDAYGFTLDWLFREDAAMMPHALAELIGR